MNVVGEKYGLGGRMMRMSGLCALLDGGCCIVVLCSVAWFELLKSNDDTGTDTNAHLVRFIS